MFPVMLTAAGWSAGFQIGSWQKEVDQPRFQTSECDKDVTCSSTSHLLAHGCDVTNVSTGRKILPLLASFVALIINYVTGYSLASNQ